MRSMMRQITALTKSIRLFGFGRGSVAYAMRLAHRLIRPSRWTTKQIRVPGVLHPVFLRPGTSDWEVLQQVFMSRSYCGGRMKLVESFEGSHSRPRPAWRADTS
jgi:hypothetical protein